MINSRLLNTVITLMLMAYSRAHGSNASGFYNLGFEDGTIVKIPDALLPTMVEFNAAIPGWSGTINGVSQTVALYNDRFLDSPGFALEKTGDSRLAYEGDYYLTLTKGIWGDAVALSQVGRLPNDAKTIQFACTYNLPTLTFDNHVIQTIPIKQDGQYIMLAGDVSAFAGKEGELSFHVTGDVLLDDISFSPLAIPEPSTVGLLLLGGFAMVWHSRKKA